MRHDAQGENLPDEMRNKKLETQTKGGETKKKYKPDTDARKVMDVAQVLLPPDSESFDSSHIGAAACTCVGEQLFVGLETAESGNGNRLRKTSSALRFLPSRNHGRNCEMGPSLL